MGFQSPVNLQDYLRADNFDAFVSEGAWICLAFASAAVRRGEPRSGYSSSATLKDMLAINARGSVLSAVCGRAYS